MTYQLVFSKHGYIVYQQEQQHLMALQHQADDLKQQRETMIRRILQLRHNPKALEDLVHERLGYVYPDEYILIMPDEKTQAKESK
ncbi:MAG: septum formation initiator family protein [Mariprofundaceae bacterium]|nr:septum formation initiator family protein [Mariprofundaceae bacterium]